jgi:hypothetical protein
MCCLEGKRSVQGKVQTADAVQMVVVMIHTSGRKRFVIEECIEEANMRGVSVLMLQRGEGSRLDFVGLHYPQDSGKLGESGERTGGFHSCVWLPSQAVATRERHKHCCEELICSERRNVRQGDSEVPSTVWHLVACECR